MCLRLRTTGTRRSTKSRCSLVAGYPKQRRTVKNRGEVGMSFDVTSALRKSTGRAKSDVANKLVSMFLHEVSRKVCIIGGMFVSDPSYAESVIASFGQECLYCGKELEKDRAPVEHLNGMNRFSVGLHVPGNVAVACKRCNNEKRRDDQTLALADNGWESFLSHDGFRCNKNCKTCAYWRTIWTDPDELRVSLATAIGQIHNFQKPYLAFINKSENARQLLRHKIEPRQKNSWVDSGSGKFPRLW